ncbi:uncharacterized protein LOC119573484 [Penaeus monodon]|uniref:uncharacterized protein LOC119573484 n=1 Tax=Penaeus monodon TaxID=6687 RepID=UPI0018A7C738|nr:uncharacterized protein LOC119573484 [Penaeus monodon]
MLSFLAYLVCVEPKQLEKKTWFQDHFVEAGPIFSLCLFVYVYLGQEFSYDADLDKYSEFELLRMVKSLERERNNLYSDLRNKSWLLDNQSKEYHHLKELIRAYTGDLTIVNRSLEHMWRQRSISRDSGFAGGATPVTSPGGVKWRSVIGVLRDISTQNLTSGPKTRKSDFPDASRLQEYHHLKELIRAYTGDLTIVNRSLEHMWRQRSISRDSGFAGGATPVTSPGGVKWSSGQSGIRPSQRILDPRKGPIRKTVGVRSLPRLDQEALDYYDAAGLSRKARSRSRGRARTRAKSLEAKKESDRLMREDERAKSSGEVVSQRSSSGVFEESSYEASNEASTSASVELGSEK